MVSFLMDLSPNPQRRSLNPYAPISLSGEGREMEMIRCLPIAKRIKVKN
jgi:hypothetical protein